MQLLQHASQMTECHIMSPRPGAQNFSMPPIIHQRLKTLSLFNFARDWNVVTMLLGSLTLPCLQEFCTNEMHFLSRAYLPALVHRSSSPLTRITLFHFEGKLRPFHDLQPLPRVTDLVLEFQCGRPCRD